MIISYLTTHTSTSYLLITSLLMTYTNDSLYVLSHLRSFVEVGPRKPLTVLVHSRRARSARMGHFGDSANSWP